ncbi:hypothetical protein D9M69_523290 [compost metagenome]
MARAHAHRAHDLAVVRGGAHHQPEARVLQQPLQRAEGQHREHQHQHRVPADAQPADLEARRGQRAAVQRARVGAEQLDHQVAQHHRDAEGDQHRRERIVGGHRAVQQQPLQQVAHAEGRQRHRRDEEERRHAGELRGQEDREVRREHHELAVREVDHAHHAEDQRQAQAEERVQAAEQHAVDEGFEPGHGGVQCPK